LLFSVPVAYSGQDRARRTLWARPTRTDIASKLEGNTQGLKPSQQKALTRLYNRRYPVQGGYTPEQARELALISHEIGRQVGLLIDRRGRPQMVIVGDPSSILIPDLGRLRQSPGRLRGLRLLHTHLGHGALSQEDLMDLLFLRLDSMAALDVDDQGEPRTFHYAHLLPQNADNKPYRVHESLPWDRVGVDFGAQVQALEDELGRTAQEEDRPAPMAGAERAVLVSVSTAPRRAQEASLAELAELARTAGVEVAGTMIQRVPKVNPKTILGKGKLAELEVLALQGNAAAILFDQELSPAQMRNLAEVSERKVVDRTQLILDIFAQHATTRAGKLQVEMAQLKYTLPRLVGRNKALSRLAGGIGGRGPGETRLELDRRKIRDRMARIRDELKKLRKQRAAARSRRAKAGVPVAALVGYTNAGKSTLLNTLTQSEVLAQNKLFATLDPTTRRLRFPHERELILTDTVGFIRHLPAELVEAFRATLEELDAADLLIHVADASHPELDEQIEAVEGILRQMDLHEVPTLLVCNKWDKLSQEERTGVRNAHPRAIRLSARTGQGLEDLSEEIVSRVDWERGLVRAN
jgi:GTP-binding protein HflX